MNSEKMALSTIVFFTIITILPYGTVSAEVTGQFTYASIPMAIAPETLFSILSTNGTVGFGQTGYYGNCTLVNDAWVFIGLQLDSAQASVLSDSPNTANLNITAKDSNMTIGSFERLLTPNGSDTQNTGIWLTPGWLNYTVNGVGTQVIRFQFNLANWTEPPQNETNGIYTWPIGVHVYVDGKEAPFNTNWTNVDDIATIPYGTGIIVTRATSNVSINYAWVPVPEPASESSNSPFIDSFPPQNPLMIYLFIAAIITIIIIPTALIINRHRLASILDKRTKRQASY
jgi:hypothetical protein